MQFILVLIATVSICSCCNITFNEENLEINEKGFRFDEISKFDSYKTKYMYSLVPESSVMIISQEGILNFKRGSDREWLCKVPDLSSTCNCKEKICKISLGIWMQERSSTKQKPPIRWHVDVCVEDKNDNCPRLPSNIHKTMSESTKVGFQLPLPIAVDLDSSIYSRAVYKLDCNIDSKKFKLNMKDNNSPQLELISSLDHETMTSHSCQFVACETGCCSSASLTIAVTDENDHSPSWTVSSWQVSVLENSPPNSQVIQLSATDSDSTYNQLTFSMDGLRQDLFLVELRSGIVRLAGYLDYETMNDKIIHLPVKVSDNGILQPKSATGTVTITVIDINDNRPVINIMKNVVLLEENISNEYLGYMTVTDADSEINGMVTCSVIHPEDKVTLKLSREVSKNTIYDIYSISSFDHETNPRISVKIVCHDMGQPKLTSEVSILLQIKDADDNNVEFKKKEFVAGIDEEREIGSLITQVEAIDKDTTSSLEYFLANKNDSQIVEIDKNTGIIRSNKVFDRELKDEYKIKVIVQEKGSSNKTDTATVYIRVLDINDNEPKFEHLYSFSVSENKEINYEIGRVAAHDPDLKNNGTVIYSQQRSDDTSSNHLLFFVDNLGKVRLFQKLDYEIQPLHHLIVIAADQGHPVARTASTTIIISVIDENDNPPKFKLKYLETDIGCHTRFFSRDLIPVTDNDTDSKNRQMQYILTMINPTSFARYFRIDNHTGEISVDIDQPNGMACSSIPKVIKMKITVYDPSFPDYRDYCMLHLKLSQPPSKPIPNDQQTPDYKKKFQDKNNSDKEPFSTNINQFDSSIFLVVILIVFSVILLLLLTCVAVFTKRCKESEQDHFPKMDSENFPQNSCSKLEKTNHPITKKSNNSSHRTEFQMFSNKLPEGVVSSNSHFSEPLTKKMEDRCRMEDERNDYQLLGQAHDFRSANHPQKYFTNYMLPCSDSPTNQPLIISGESGSTFLAMKPTVSTSFV